MGNDLAAMAEEVRRALFPAASAPFDPVRDWSDLGRLVTAMEERGCFLMTNSATAPKLKRMASFHQSTPRGFPCVGSSEWGPFATHGEAILLAAWEALMKPRA